MRRTFDLGDSATQKKFGPKNRFLLGLFSIGKSVFWANFFWCTFYGGQMYIFEISVKRLIFCYPFRPI
jgi:hypothetical protein